MLTKLALGPSMCTAKWTNSTIHLGIGKTHSCHHPHPHTIPLHEIKNNPSAIHNTQHKKQVRKQMLEGVCPSECNYCWNAETNGTVGDRVLMSKKDGLLELLKNWPKIKTIMPHATLDIYSPGYSIANHTDYSFNKFKEVTCHGTVDQKTLHNAMLRAEYWCYITDYEETYCITALEMQYAKVLPIVTKVAALKETVNSGVILERNETNWNQVIQILGTLSSGLKDKSINDAYKWSKQQTWNVRSYDWKNILESI